MTLPDSLASAWRRPVCGGHILLVCAIFSAVCLCILEAAYSTPRPVPPNVAPGTLAAGTLREQLAEAWKLIAAPRVDNEDVEGRYNFTTIGSQVDVAPVRTRARIGKCTSLYGSYGQDYYRALATHIKHNEAHHYDAYVLNRSILDGIWSKQAALLAVVLEELEKPKDDRLEWLAWYDADTMVFNRLVPLEIFLPPPDLTVVQALVTQDWNGLNAGVFLLRVSEWTVEFLSAVLAFPIFRPDVQLTWSEQSAMDVLLREERFANGSVIVPARWFNAYPGGARGEKSLKIRKGDLSLHFAGIGDKVGAMQEYLNDLEANRTKWEIPLEKTNLTSEAAWFWQGYRLRVDSD